MSNPLLTVSRVSKVFQWGSEELKILSDVSLDLQEGSTTTIVGESGSGKSTLLHMIGGLESVTSGSIMFKQKDIAGYSDKALTAYRKNHIGFIFQNPVLLSDFTVLENCYIPAYLAGSSKKDLLPRAKSLLEEVGLSHRLDHYPGTLSGGEQQRLSIARSLIHNPQLLLADEPTGSLDEDLSATIQEIFLELVRRKGVTLLLVTHNQKLAQTGDQRVRLTRGQVEFY